tara:strand:+ start:2244 stop:2678 length:435 start_codon:yes stop_codon:yes gene_type:complete
MVSIGLESVLQIIVLPKQGQIEDVTIARVYMSMLPFVIQLGIEANCVASGALGEKDPGIVVPTDLVTIVSDLHARILGDITAHREIIGQCRKADGDADEVVEVFKKLWCDLFFGSEVQARLSEIAISGPCDDPVLTVRIEAPEY